MPKTHAFFTYSPDFMKALEVPKGYLLLKYDPQYRETLGKFFNTLDAWQKKEFDKLKIAGKIPQPEDFMRPLDITIEYHYKKRTLDQNALMWSLYTVEANEMNGGQSGAADQNVQPMELYFADLKQHGERETITTRCRHLPAYRTEYKIIETVTLEDGSEYPYKGFLKLQIPPDDRITLRVIRGSSKFDTKEMAQWIDRIFTRLAFNGLSLENADAIKTYWHTWREGLNESKIVLHDSIMTQAEYKALNPICEACGIFVGNGTGELAHIQGFGMGGDRSAEPAKNYTSNWLHLCHNCHIGVWHGQGIKQFLIKYRSLTYKVNTALKRDYAPIKE